MVVDVIHVRLCYREVERDTDTYYMKCDESQRFICIIKTNMNFANLIIRNTHIHGPSIIGVKGKDRDQVRFFNLCT